MVMAKRLSARPQAKSSMPLDLWSSKHKIVNKCNTWGALFQPQVKEYHDENVHIVLMSNSLYQESITYTGRCDENVLVRLKECRFLRFHSLEPVYSIFHILILPYMTSIVLINWYKSFFLHVFRLICTVFVTSLINAVLMLILIILHFALLAIHTVLPPATICRNFKETIASWKLTQEISSFPFYTLPLSLWA